MVQGRPSTDVLGCFSFEFGFAPPVAQGPQTGPPKTSSHASSCAMPNHWPFFFFKQLHLSLSLARKSHSLQCRYKVWVPALQASISLYSLASGGRLREEGQGMGSGRSFRLSGFALLKPVLDKSVCYYLLLLHRLSLFQKGWERLQRGHKLRLPEGTLQSYFPPASPHFQDDWSLCPLRNSSPSRLLRLIRSPNWRCRGSS